MLGARALLVPERPVNPLLRDRVLRRLDVMSDERAYEILDYIEFLESKYAERPTLATSFQHFADGIEDTLRAGRLPAATVAEAMTFLDRAAGVLRASPRRASQWQRTWCTATKPSTQQSRTRTGPSVAHAAAPGAACFRGWGWGWGWG